MPKTIPALLIATAVLAAPIGALAKTYKLGGQRPVASITLPDAWSGDVADGGVESLSPEKDIYFSAEIVAAEDLKSAGQDLAKTLKEQKIQLKQESRKVAPITIAGMQGATIAWDASDAEGPTQVHMVVLKAKPDKEVVLLRWGDEAAEKAHAVEIDGIVKSVVAEK